MDDGVAEVLVGLINTGSVRTWKAPQASLLVCACTFSIWLSESSIACRAHLEVKQPFWSSYQRWSMLRPREHFQGASVELPADMIVVCEGQVWVGTSAPASRKEAGNIFRIMQQSKIALGRPIK